MGNDSQIKYCNECGRPVKMCICPVRCPECKGQGWLQKRAVENIKHEKAVHSYKCAFCNGRGTVPKFEAEL